MRLVRRIALLTSLPLLFAFYPYKKPKPQVRTGDAWDGKALKVLVLPATCSAPDEACEDEFVDGLTGLLLSELEFAGYSVVDARKLVADQRSRDEVDAEISVFGAKVAEASSTRQVGSLFEDLSPALQAALMEVAGTSGVVSGRIAVGARDGLGPTRASTVTLRLGLGDGTEMGWMSRCEVKSALNPPLGQSLDYGARCALKGALEGK